MKKKIALCANGWSLDAFSDAIEGFKTYAKMNDYEFDMFVFLSFASYSINQSALMQGELNIYNLCNPTDYDAIVVFSGMLNSNETARSICMKAKEKNVPVVSIGMQIDGISSVCIDNTPGMHDIVTHVIEEHHAKKIFFMAGTKNHIDSEERLRITKEVMEAHGLTLDDEDIGYGTWSNGRTVRSLNELLETHDYLPDAIICANDIMALAVCTELRKKGISVPDQIIVTGFDNIKSSTYFYPALTTVKQDYATVAQECCKILFEESINDNSTKAIIVPTVPIIAESCGCIGNAEYTKIRQDYCMHSFSRDRSAKLLEQNERDLREHTSSVADYSDLKEQLRAHFLDNHQFEGSSFYIVLKKSFFENVIASEEEICKDGLKGLLDIVVGIKDNKLIDVEKIDSKQLIPCYDKESHNQHVYYICPLHYFEHNYGYAVFTDIAYILNESIMSPYLEKLQQFLRFIRINLRLKLLYDMDPSTGLYNRFGYETKALPLYEESLKNLSKITVLFVDINFMKRINDDYGHDQGDIAIITVASSIKDCLEEQWVAVRYGGDEFLVIVPDCDEEKAVLVKQHIEDRLKERARESQLPYQLTISTGYMTTDPVGRPDATLKEYVREADILMYKIKNKMHDHFNK